MSRAPELSVELPRLSRSRQNRTAASDSGGSILAPKVQRRERRNDPAVRVLLLVDYRPQYEHRWGNRTSYSQMQLDALPAEHADLLQELLGEDPSLQPLKQLLVKRGNPLFLEESVRTLVETRALEGNRRRYRLTGRLG